MLRIEGFEIPIVGLMELDQDGHNFTCRELAAPLAFDLPCRKQGLMPARSECVPKIVDSTKQCE
jgi:hypothetical protein